MLNMGIDTTDPNPQHIPEELTFNDQESSFEIVIETVLGYEDAIKEYDDIDAEGHNTNKKVC